MTYHRITPANTALLVIDVQEKLFSFIDDNERLKTNLLRLIQGIQALEMPIVVTEQYRRGIGPTIPEIQALFNPFEYLEKSTFSCADDRDIQATIDAIDRPNWLVCGIETHACVYQTIVDFASQRETLHLVTDAVGSREAKNKKLAIKRAEALGAQLTSVEMCLLELLQDSRHPQFKIISKLIK